MLMQAIRDRAQSWIAWVIIALLILVFAVWGINSYFEPESRVSVAEVNGQKISQVYFQQAYDFQRARIQQQFGGSVDPQLLESLGLKNQVLQQVVEEEVELQTATDLGFRVGDEQLARFINEIQVFQREGKFDRELYEQVLASNMTSPVVWEAQQRRALLLDQPVKGLLSTAIVSDKQIAQLVRIRNQERSIGYAVVDLARFSGDVSVEEAAIEQYYNEHKDEFMDPERVRVEYLELSLAAIAKDIPVDEGALHQLYEEQKMTFGTEERRKASHILIEVGSDADKATVDEARQKIDELAKRIQAGESFEELAKAHSQDPGSAAQGGDLGYFGRGIMDKAFEDAAFALDKGQVSDVVRSAFGFHLIKVTDIEAEKVKSFDEVRDELQIRYKNMHAEDQFFSALEQLESLVFENPDNLSVAADALGLEVQTSDYFSRNAGAGIAGDARVRNAAFDEDVLEAGNNSPAIELEGNRVVVVRIKDRQAAAPKTLAEVKAQIESKLRDDEAVKKAKATADALLEKLRAGGDVESVVKEAGYEWQAPGFVGRESPELDRRLLDDVFGIRTEGDKAVFGETNLSNGDVAVYALFEVRDGDPSKLTADERRVIQDGQVRTQGQASLRGLVDEWKQNAKIIVFPDNI